MIFRNWSQLVILFVFPQNEDEAGPSTSKSKFSRLQRLRDLELKMVCVSHSQNYTGNLNFQIIILYFLNFLDDQVVLTLICMSLHAKLNL